MLFADRRDAGRQLARKLELLDFHDPLVLALPRGGVPVAFEVARALGAALDVFIVRKLGTPGQRELAMGALAAGDVVFVNRDVLDALGLPDSVIDSAVLYARKEIEEQEQAFRGDRPALPIEGREIILVDDGLATGSTMRAAVRAVKQKKARRVTVAVPVAARSTCDAMRHETDDVVCLWTPEPFSSVGQWYRDFTQTTDDEVRRSLTQADARSKVR